MLQRLSIQSLGEKSGNLTGGAIMWKWIGGVGTAVLIGVLTWVFTDGLKGLFEGAHPSPPIAIASPPDQPHKPAGRGACADGSAPDHGFHNVAAANGSWDWDCNGQVETERGACESLARAQCDPNTNVTRASPGFCSQIRGVAGCSPGVAACGTQGYIYPCFYNAADGRCHAGGYETAAVQRCR